MPIDLETIYVRKTKIKHVVVKHSCHRTRKYYFKGYQNVKIRTFKKRNSKINISTNLCSGTPSVNTDTIVCMDIVITGRHTNT